MKESLRKPLLFVVIVVVGSVLVLFDIPLLLLLPLLLLVGFGTLLALGSITIAEIRGGIAGLGKTGILKRLNDIKFFEKKPADAKKVPPPVRGEERRSKREKERKARQSPVLLPISRHFSPRSVRWDPYSGKRADREKRWRISTSSSTKPSARKYRLLHRPAWHRSCLSGGGGTSPGKGLDMDDPFMSLSGDEFDEGLLEGLGDDDGMVISAPAPGEEPAFNPADFPDLETDADLPEPTHAISSAAGIHRQMPEKRRRGLLRSSAVLTGETCQMQISAILTT